MSGYRIAVDYGTSNSAAAIADLPSLEAREVRVNGESTIPSLVVLGRQGLLGGSAAAANAASYPDAVAPTPKRSLGDPLPVIRSPRTVDATEAAATTIRILLEHAAAMRANAAPAEVVLTHPAGFGETRLGALFAALRQAGVGPEIRVGMLAEPVAAALRYQAVDPVAVGESVAVYDLGAGTLDTAILRRTEVGFAIDARGGDPGIGGELFDDILFEFLLGQVDPADADALRNATDPTWVDARRKFRLAVRLAKEALSTTPGGVDVPYPRAGRDPLWLSTDDLNEQLGGPIGSSIDMLEHTIAQAGIRPDQLRHVYLVGGSSKIPLIQTLMTQRLGVGGRTYDDRKLVVTLGAAGAPAEAITWDRTVAAPPAVVVPPDGPREPVPPPPVPVPPRPPVPPRRSGMSVPLMAGAAALVALVALIVVVRFGIWPTPTPTHAPFTPAPTSAAVTLPPTDAPTLAPTAAPTAVPTDAPTEAPTAVPTDAPSAEPTRRPATAEQSGVPTVAGTDTDQWLLDAVGTRPDVVAPCAISTEGFATGQIAQVNCNLSGAGPITSATFLLFESRDAMDAYMNTQVDRSYGNSTACGPKKQWWFTSTPATIEGLVWCGTGPNADGAARTWLQWTEDGNRILGSLSVADVTPQQLYDEWFKADFAAAS